MPTYEYACRDCGEHLEVVQSFTDDPLTACPGCQGRLRKVFTAAGIVFKGSGWHIKDYAASSGSPSNDGEPSSRSDSSSDSSSGSSGESKAEKKSA
jgi:putative FmdB family regulatory protein